MNEDLETEPERNGTVRVPTVLPQKVAFVTGDGDARDGEPPMLAYCL